MAQVARTATSESEWSGTRKAAQKATNSQTCSNVDITPAKNGGFSVRCSYRDKTSPKNDYPGYHEPEVHAFSTYGELETFLREELGGGDSDDEGDE